MTHGTQCDCDFCRIHVYPLTLANTEETTSIGRIEIREDALARPRMTPEILLPLRLLCLCGAAMEIARCDGQWLLGHIEGATPSTCLPLLAHANFALVLGMYTELYDMKISGSRWLERERAPSSLQRSSRTSDDVAVTLAVPLSLEEALRIRQRSQPSTALYNEDGNG